MKNRDLINLLNRAAAAVEDALLPSPALTRLERIDLVQDLCVAAEELTPIGEHA
jgi:hypothetical protein